MCWKSNVGLSAYTSIINKCNKGVSANNKSEYAVGYLHERCNNWAALPDTKDPQQWASKTVQEQALIPLDTMVHERPVRHAIAVHNVGSSAPFPVSKLIFAFDRNFFVFHDKSLSSPETGHFPTVCWHYWWNRLVTRQKEAILATSLVDERGVPQIPTFWAPEQMRQ